MGIRFLTTKSSGWVVITRNSCFSFSFFYFFPAKKVAKTPFLSRRCCQRANPPLSMPLNRLAPLALPQGQPFCNPVRLHKPLLRAACRTRCERKFLTAEELFGDELAYNSNHFEEVKARRPDGIPHVRDLDFLVLLFVKCFVFYWNFPNCRDRL